MINIEVRQNNEFELGYPYNTNVDLYFQNLTSSYIKNYGLSLESIQDINNHKNFAMQFDKLLHDFIIKMSAFIIGFDTVGQPMIDEFNKLNASKNNYTKEYSITETNKIQIDNELTFINNNIDILQIDCDKLDKLLIYYNAQLLPDDMSFSETFIDDSLDRINFINSVLLKITDEREYYYNLLNVQINDMIEKKSVLFTYSFSDVLIKTMYESWILYNDAYYKSLINYFKDIYESVWTYGTSLLYEQTLKLSKSSNIMYKNVFEKLQETIFKSYNFNIEKEVKEYAVTWLSKPHNIELFTSHVEHKRKDILLENILIIENIIIDKTKKFRKIVSTTKENNYYIYRELVQEKIKYEYMHIITGIDADILNDYNMRLASLYDDYIFVESQLTNVIYWEVKAELEIYNALLIDIKRQLDNTNRLIDIGFKKIANDNNNILSKIQFYASEKEKVLFNISEMKKIYSTLELDLESYKDKLTILSSKIFEIDTLMKEQQKHYTIFFNERIPFFTQNITSSENDAISSLLDGDYSRDFNIDFDTFSEYKPNIIWYDVDTRDKLVTYYSFLISIIKVELEKEWVREFDHNILSYKKMEVLSYYIDKKLKRLYGILNIFLMNKKNDNEIIDTFDISVEHIIVNFKQCIHFHIIENKNLKINMDMFNYNNYFEFKISEGLETTENMYSMFISYFDNLRNFIFEKNIEFNNSDSFIAEQEKIDYIWLDMEKKYV